MAKMNTHTKNKKEKGEMEQKQPKIEPKIMTKPLPEILDELENYIKRVEEAVRDARAAAKDAREAAAQAEISGQNAAEAAKKAANAAVAEVREESARANKAVNTRVTDLENEVSEFKDNAKQEAFAVDQGLLESQRKHLEESPFLKN